MKPAQRRALIAARRKGLAFHAFPDWRDPDMPVVLKRRNPETGEIELYNAKPEMRNRIAEQGMLRDAPPWHRDPTYNLRRK